MIQYAARQTTRNNLIDSQWNYSCG